MIFNICLENHTDDTAPAHLTDLVRTLRYGIEANHHDVYLNYHLLSDPSIINLVVERFDGNFAAKLEALHAQGGHFIIVVNQSIVDDNGHTRDLAVRLKNFARVAHLALACWNTVPAQSNAYLERFQLSRVLPLRYGYHPELERVIPKHHKDIDVLFTGTNSPHRTEVLKTLAGLGLNVYTERTKTPDYMREELVGRTKLALDLRHHPSTPYSAVGRLSYHVINHSPLLSERAALPGDFDDFVMHAEPGEEFINHVLTLVETDLAPMAEAAYSRLLAERPLKGLFASLLDATFASDSVSAPITDA